MRIVSTLILSLFTGVMAPSAAGEQDQNQWTKKVTPYAWLVGIDAKTQSLTAPPGDPLRDVEIGFDEIWDNLDFAFMGTAEVQSNSFGFLLDIAYGDVSVSATPDSVAFASADLDTSFILGTAVATLNGHRSDQSNLDFLAGVRVLDVDTNVSVVGILGNTRTFSSEDSLVDPVIGARYQHAALFNTDWSFNAIADIGGFGMDSEFTWQIATTLEYKFGRKSSFHAGYRHVDYELKNSAVVPELAISGPLFGLSLKF